MQSTAGINRQDGREALLRAGDFTLTRHYDIIFPGVNCMLC
jgi:hypothetical protein